MRKILDPYIKQLFDKFRIYLYTENLILKIKTDAPDEAHKAYNEYLQYSDMKERVESKLGKTIEEYVEERRKLYDILHKKEDMNVDYENNPLSIFDDKEKEFIVAYIERNGLEIYT